MNKVKLNELELIKLTMEYGYDGRELNNAHFIENGYLKNNNFYKKFMDKVNSICECAEKQRKKKGELHPTYIITGLKEKGSIVKVEDKRVMNGLGADDIEMAYFFFNELIEMDLSKKNSFHQWAIDVGAFNTYLVTDKFINKLFSKMYYGIELKEIKDKFIRYIKNRNKALAHNSIKILKSKGLISTTYHYIAKNEHREIVEIDKSAFELFNDEFSKILTSYKLDRYNYTYQLSENEKLRSDINDLKESTGIHSCWIAVKIKLLSTTPIQAMNSKEFQRMYWDKTINAIAKLEDKTKYDLLFSCVFKKYNYALIIKELGYGNEQNESIISKVKHHEFKVELIMIQRKNKGLFVPEDWEDINELFSGNEPVKKQVETVQDESDFDVHAHLENVSLDDEEIIVTDEMLPF